MSLSALRALGIAESSIDAEPVDLVADSACLLFAFLSEGKGSFCIWLPCQSDGGSSGRGLRLPSKCGGFSVHDLQRCRFIPASVGIALCRVSVARLVALSSVKCAPCTTVVTVLCRAVSKRLYSGLRTTDMCAWARWADKFVFRGSVAALDSVDA
ncbi:hypothetical protein ARMSODRAFT_742 [Armillaria solidipes]|uniref:Uncharacterized protein n=1 Tax=Armillaria solidipes TaxID=1076256 RepID=A0A2H3C3J6_9AGAR|nr:hypothetical protein ARMSODRAFT_742 [Armillaria solidipes]